MVIVHVGWYLLWFIPPLRELRWGEESGWSLWRHDRCTLPASGSLSFTSRGLINQKEAPLPSLSLSPRLLVAFSFIPCHRHPLLSAFIFILLFRFSSPACIHACMYVYIYPPSKRRVWERGGGARIRVSFAAVPREAFGSRCRVCRKHRGSGHSLSRSGSRVQLCRRRGN